MLWQELDNFRPIPTCECDISCSAIDKIHNYRDSDQQQGQVNNVSTYPDQEVEDQHETFEEQLNDVASGLIGFTHAQHKVILELLHQSSTPHSVNHLVTQPKSDSVIICTIPNQDIAESFILDT
ncbi:hypothetical protein KIW84_075748 [Lathyrus oleraceus]|uniref:Uncharacterized protein n=1 Tax=Pisum sativum TaxID=3888 RepID=A0A9D5A2C1_PEA|nr:hypothetical protein KIW84_075748 [Pisum sativum]